MSIILFTKFLSINIYIIMLNVFTKYMMKYIKINLSNMYYIII